MRICVGGELLEDMDMVVRLVPYVALFMRLLAERRIPSRSFQISWTVDLALVVKSWYSEEEWIPSTQSMTL